MLKGEYFTSISICYHVFENFRINELVNYNLLFFAFQITSNDISYKIGIAFFFFIINKKIEKICSSIGPLKLSI